MHLECKRIVLTGAAGGMGALIATELAVKGARLVLTDINAQQPAQQLATIKRLAG